MEYNPISVTELNLYMKKKIDTDEYLNNVMVKGEISKWANLATYTSSLSSRETVILSIIVCSPCSRIIDFMRSDSSDRT